MSLVRVMTRKWPDAPHWEYDALRLGEDDLGVWVGLPRGTWMARPGMGMPAAADHVVLLPHDAWWIATLYGDDPARPFDTYVDITTPCTWSEDGSSATAIDLDLDVVQGTTGRVWVDDEDEFAEHRVSLGYPAHVVAAATRSCDEVLRLVQAKERPFDGTAYAWIETLRSSATGR